MSGVECQDIVLSGNLLQWVILSRPRKLESQLQAADVKPMDRRYLAFIHSFRPFLLRPFKSSTTQRRSRLQHGYCIGVSRRSAQATPGKQLAQGPYVTAREGVEPTTLRLKVIDSTKVPSRPRDGALALERRHNRNGLPIREDYRNDLWIDLNRQHARSYMYLVEDWYGN